MKKHEKGSYQIMVDQFAKNLDTTKLTSDEYIEQVKEDIKLIVDAYPIEGDGILSFFTPLDIDAVINEAMVEYEKDKDNGVYTDESMPNGHIANAIQKELSELNVLSDSELESGMKKTMAMVKMLNIDISEKDYKQICMKKNESNRLLKEYCAAYLTDDIVAHLDIYKSEVNIPVSESTEE